MGKIYRRSVIFVDTEIKRDRKLITWVKRWPLIYDKTDPLHFDAKERRKIWETIAEHLQNTAKECEERWKTLVDIYKNYKTGMTMMHEALYEQLDECLNRLPKNINFNVEGIYDLPQMVPEGNEDLDDLSLASSQEYDSFFQIDNEHSYRMEVTEGGDYHSLSFVPVSDDEVLPLSPSQEEMCFMFFKSHERKV